MPSEGAICLEAAQWEAKGEKTRERLSRKPAQWPGLRNSNPGVAALPSLGLDAEPEARAPAGRPALTWRASLILALQSNISPFPGSPLEPYKTNEVSTQGLGRQGPAACCLSNRTAANTGCAWLHTGGSRAARGGAYWGLQTLSEGARELDSVGALN